MSYQLANPSDGATAQPVSKVLLLVEDSDDDAFLFKRALKLAEVVNQVVRVENGDEAINYLLGQGRYADRMLFPLPFVILLDLRLPGTDGWEVLKWIRSRAQFEKTLVAILSGFDGDTTIQQSQELGANTFLRKPCNAGDLRSLTRNFPGDWQTRSG